MWLYEESNAIDLKINNALIRAKRSIMGDNKAELIKKVAVNASGQIAIRADIVAENAFLDSMVSDGLSGVLYSEESGVKRFGREPKDDDAIILLLDPLDGSQNYLKGLSLGCISVAYGSYNETPTLSDLNRAAILNLYSDDLFFGIRGIGAWFNEKKLETSTNSQLPSDLSQLSFYAYGEVAKRFFFDFQEKYSLRSLGSAAWELVLTTIGINDAFVDLRGVLRAHDFIAAKIIIESIGGVFSYLDDVDDDSIFLDTFKSGYSVVASYYPKFTDLLIEDLKKHGLISN